MYIRGFFALEPGRDVVGTAFGTRKLVLKLIPHEGKLIGRVTARGARPGLLLANIPYVLTLNRA